MASAFRRIIDSNVDACVFFWGRFYRVSTSLRSLQLTCMQYRPTQIVVFFVLLFIILSHFVFRIGDSDVNSKQARYSVYKYESCLGDGFFFLQKVTTKQRKWVESEKCVFTQKPKMSKTKAYKKNAEQINCPIPKVEVTFFFLRIFSLLLFLVISFRSFPQPIGYGQLVK